MRTVNIIGCAAGWENAPADGQSWGITSLVLKRPVTVVFDMHDLLQPPEAWISHYTLWLGSYYGRNYIKAKAAERVASIPRELAEVKRLGIPLYSTRTYEKVPTSRAYPLKAVKSKFTPHPFSGTFDYLAALALYVKVDHLNIYGVNMDYRSEYVHQLMSANYWLGRCIGSGMKVTVHGESMLLRSMADSDYGYNKEAKDAI